MSSNEEGRGQLQQCGGGEEQKEKVLMKAKGSKLCLHTTGPVFCCGLL